ncbi:enoyl-CoA hydratase/isomerase family protein [Verminephrobacter eiseniae]|nr:enoyl-CoA hydratase/isomerase family protein [Verminephrobacter eiseniae]MCW5302527.1 enoyl-CoA hydratase/isomerase family protein [Verminephrobacter eiseniae]MCW8178351.1 enoyl-CoA hydratase/isomerase family protein [Verminephrobacter eiseniae]MCW8189078.1 enoyl-CoA hydratase/isomerase family protein [Verminephrobacter eiseniae]
MSSTRPRRPCGLPTTCGRWLRPFFSPRRWDWCSNLPGCAVADEWVQTAIDGALATVTLNRPDKLNTLTPVMLDALENAARRLEAERDVRVVILTGAGERAFCAGADIHAWAALQPLDMWRRWVRRGHQVFDQWARLRQPVIAALNGHAFGGGLELAIACDLRIADQAAQFALPEARIATCPGWSGTQRLVRLIGPSAAKYLALSGQRLDSAGALRCGLLHEVTTTAAKGAALERAQQLAQQMCEQAPVSLQLAKQLINAAADEDAAACMEAMAGALAAFTDDAKEGVSSFRDKRPPHYTGR